MDDATNRLEQTVHGAFDYGELERLGLHPREVLDFSVNINPYGPSPLVREAIANAAIDRYPDRECLALRRAILDYELASSGLPLGSIVCGNGTSELIWAIARAYLKPGLKAAILGPTFGEYRAACLAAGATVVEFQAQASAYFQPDTEAVAGWIGSEHPTIVWLCNPNNPTGTWLDQHSVQLVAEACRGAGAMFVVDEAYWRFVFPHEEFSAVELLNVTGGQQIIVLRSLTKDFALTGLRLGYAITTLDIAVRLGAQMPSWNVNGVAQEAAIAAIADRTYLTTTLEKLAIERLAFFRALRDIGLYVMQSRTHFSLIEVGDARRVRQQLLKRKILVRDCNSFGLPRFIRIATRPMVEWQQLLHALEEIV
jgi:histidinol-phosphate aminotransferase